MVEELEKAIKKVYEEFMQMSYEEFHKMLKEHKSGDIAQIIFETGALDVGKIEAKAFDYNNYR